MSTFKETVTALRERNASAQWLQNIPNVDEYQRHGTMRKWFQARDGMIVHTVQVNTTKDAINAWCPLNRTIDATRAGSVSLNGSIRDYAGMKVLHNDPNVLIVADSWHTIAYVAD